MRIERSIKFGLAPVGQRSKSSSVAAVGFELTEAPGKWHDAMHYPGYETSQRSMGSCREDDVEVPLRKLLD